MFPGDSQRVRDTSGWRSAFSDLKFVAFFPLCVPVSSTPILLGSPSILTE